MSPELEARSIAIDKWFEARQSKPLALEFYMVALAGEVGEAANMLKKSMRGDELPAGFWGEFALELADIELYLRHLARKAGVDLDLACARKIEICEQRWGIPRATP